MTDNEQAPKSSFKLLDEGTMFTARYFWKGEDGLLTCAIGVWPMADIDFVGTMPERVLPDMPEPKCLMSWSGGYLYLQAEFQEVQVAFRQYKKAAQVRKIFPFSSIVPFSGN